MQTNDSSENYGADTGVCSQFTSEDARNDLDFAGKQMFCNDEEFCTTEKAHKDANGSPQTKAQWNEITFSSDDQGQTGDSETYPDTYENMISRMGEIEKTLATVKETLSTASVRCHLLNVDVVTMFSPEMLDILNITKEQCEDCIKAMKTLSAEDY